MNNRVQNQRTESEYQYHPVNTFEGSPNTPIHKKGWWLNVLRNSPSYRQLEITEGGRVIALLPYFLQTAKLGFKWGRNPEWVSAYSPIFSGTLPADRKADVLGALVDLLPQSASYYFCFNLELPHVVEVISALRKRGFTHSQELTYQSFPHEPDVLSRVKSKFRSQLRHAQRKLDVTEISPVVFIQFYETNLKLRKTKSFRSLELAQQLLEASVLRGNGRIIAARSENTHVDGKNSPSQLDAAIACIWDGGRYYYWMSTVRGHPAGVTDAKPHKDAIKVLLLSAMDHAKSLNLVFDTDGGGNAGAQHLYKNVLQIKTFEVRDVFIRTRPIARLYEWLRPQLLRILRYWKLIADVATGRAH